MQIDGAVIKEKGVTFAVVVVKPHVIRNQSTADEARAGFQRLFPGMPIVANGTRLPGPFLHIKDVKIS